MNLSIQRSTCVIALLVASVACRGRAGDLPLLSGGELSGLRILRTERYDGKALFGYMDGGAELYQEYGFVRLAVQRLQYGGEDLTAELYEMIDSLAAFGIFSVHRFGAAAAESLGTASTSTAYHAQFAAGRFFVRVVNTTGTSNAKALALRVAATIERKLTTPVVLSSPLLWVLWPDPRSHSYFRGVLGVQNGFPDWADLLEGFSGFEMYLARADAPGVTFADLRMRDASDRIEFLTRWKKETILSHTCWEIGKNRLILLEAENPSDSLYRAVEATVARVDGDR